MKALGFRFLAGSGHNNYEFETLPPGGPADHLQHPLPGGLRALGQRVPHVRGHLLRTEGGATSALTVCR